MADNLVSKSIAAANAAPKPTAKEVATKDVNAVLKFAVANPKTAAIVSFIVGVLFGASPVIAYLVHIVL